MTAQTDQVKTIANSQKAKISGFGEDGILSLTATGHLTSFRTAYAHIAKQEDGSVHIDEKSAKNLGLSQGDTVWHIPR